MLAVGILLGLLLGLVSGGLVEIGTGSSLPRHAGLVRADRDVREESTRPSEGGKEPDVKPKPAALDSSKPQGEIGLLAEKLAREREEKRQKELDDSREKLRRREETIAEKDKEIARLQSLLKKSPTLTKPKAELPPAGPVVVAARPLIAEEWRKSDTPVKLFTAKNAGRNPHVQLVGSLGGVLVEPEAGGPQVTITGPGTSSGDRLAATLSVDEKGVVTLTGRGLSTRPLLGLAVIKVVSGGHTEYRQLFQKLVVSPQQSKRRVVFNDVGQLPRNRFALDPYDSLTGPLKDEYRSVSVQRGALAFDRGVDVWLKLDRRDVKLLPLEADKGPDPPTVLKSRGGNLEVTATLEKGGVEFEVVATKGTDVPKELTVVSLQVVRPIKDGGATLIQELFQIKEQLGGQ